MEQNYVFEKINEYMSAVKHLCQMKLEYSASKKTELSIQGIEEEKESLLNSHTSMEDESEMMPLEYLFRLFECNEFERHCVLMAVGFELFVSVRAALRSLEENQYNFLTAHMLMLSFEYSISETTCFHLLNEDTLLMKLFFTEDYENEVCHKNLKLDRRILTFILGDISIYQGYSSYFHFWDKSQPLETYYTEKNILNSMIRCVDYENGRKHLINIYGEEGSGRKFAIGHLGKHKKASVFYFNMESLLKRKREKDNGLLELIREVTLFQGIPTFVEVSYGEEEKKEKIMSALNEFMNYFDLVFITSSKRVYLQNLDNKIDVVALKIEKLSILESKRIWEQEGRKLKIDSNVTIGDMANKFLLTPGKIKEALRTADYYSKCEQKDSIDDKSLKRGCYSTMEESMGNRTVKINAEYTWNELILPEYPKKQIMTACNQITYKHYVYGKWELGSKISYGKGTSIVFAGPPGTGKTMAAQVIANEIGLDLYKVELSSIVSKYVGETEKNLNEIFEQAKKSQIILFFDEADVLFSKRTEVKDANDKYNNMEAAFMLQKIEEYEGITILATNYLQNFDEAFKRRMKFIIDFPFPDRCYRKEIWKTAFPIAMPVEEIDMDYLANTFELSGSNIKNVVLYSAFLAAGAKEAVGMKHIILGIKNEFSKSGKILSKTDVGEYYMLLD